MKSNEQAFVREIDLESAKSMVKAQATEVWQALFSYVTLFHHTRIHLSDFQYKPQALIYHPEKTNTHNEFRKPHPDS